MPLLSFKSCWAKLHTPTKLDTLIHILQCNYLNILNLLHSAEITLRSEVVKKPLILHDSDRRTCNFAQVYNTFIPHYISLANQDIFFPKLFLLPLTPLTTYQCNVAMSKSVLQFSRITQMEKSVIKLRKE